MDDFQGLGGGTPQYRYRLIANKLMQDISDGVYPVGSMLPGELELCEHFGVSRHTVREAIRSLREKGLVYRHQGVGTLVKASHVESHYIQEMGSLSDLVHYAEKTSLKVLKKEEVRVDGELQTFLDCKEGEVWLCVEGTRFGVEQKDLAIAYTSIFLPPGYVGIKRLIGSDKEPVYTLIEKHFGESVLDVQQEISAVSISEKYAKALGVEAGSPGLCIIRKYFGSNGQIMEVAVNVHPGERFRYSMNIRRDYRNN